MAARRSNWGESEPNHGDPATAGEFGKIARPFTDPKPGKLAYAFRYKASLGR